MHYLNNNRIMFLNMESTRKLQEVFLTLFYERIGSCNGGEMKLQP